MSNFFIYNDKVYKDCTPVIIPHSRSFRYGDGIFETLKVINGVIQLSNYHFDRLYAALEMLQFQIPVRFTRKLLEEKIAELCNKNKHTSYTRVRLTIFRGNGGLYDPENHLPNYIIQSLEIEPAEELNINGLIIDLYPHAKKSSDIFSNLKSNNFLPYVMAALYAKEKKVNDCILLNNHDNICDSTLANIFIIKDHIIYTPSLSEGCVAGVMRRCIIERMSAEFKIIEKPLSIQEMETADEVFLTNAIRGIQWVKQFKNTEYVCSVIKQVHAILKKWDAV